MQQPDMPSRVIGIWNALFSNEPDKTTPMQTEPSESIIFPALTDRDRKLCERAVRQLQAHGVIADFSGGDDPEAAELYVWSERNIPLIESYFRFAGLGVRAQQGFPIIQLVLEDDAQSHPLRRRMDKTETGLLVCLWIMYQERMGEVDGFLVPVTVGEVYARLAALFRTDKEVPETLFREVIRLFERYCLVQTDWLPDNFLMSRLGLLPTLLTTFRFQNIDQAQRWIASESVHGPSGNHI
jgi:hypothetical protein